MIIKTIKLRNIKEKMINKIRDECWEDSCNIFTILTFNIHELLITKVSRHIEYPSVMEECKFSVHNDIVNYYYEHVLNSEYILINA